MNHEDVKHIFWNTYKEYLGIRGVKDNQKKADLSIKNKLKEFIKKHFLKYRFNKRNS